MFDRNQSIYVKRMFKPTSLFCEKKNQIKQIVQIESNQLTTFSQQFNIFDTINV